MSEKEVFVQEVSDEEMEAVAGGEEKNSDGCVKSLFRDISNPSFPNCAATVEDGSECFSNDACVADAVRYYDMTYCFRAWS